MSLHRTREVTAKTRPDVRAMSDAQAEERLQEAKPSRSDMNSVIMDYLVTEGYPEAARRFGEESGMDPSLDMEIVQLRVGIRDAIYTGHVQAAIELLNELNPEANATKILDTNPELHFSLLRLQLIELIRSTINSSSNPATASFTPAIEFATSQLAPRAPTSPAFLQDLERTMALLIFPPEKLTPQLKTLLDLTLRQETATSVNEAILVSQGQAREARIRGLVRLRQWSEQTTREANIKVPRCLAFDTLKDRPFSGEAGALDRDGDVIVS